MNSPNVIPFPGAAAALHWRRLADGMREPAAVIASDGQLVHINAAWEHSHTRSGRPQSLTLQDESGQLLELRGAVEPFDAYAALSGEGLASVCICVSVTPLAAGEFGLVVASSLASPTEVEPARPTDAEIAWLLFDQAFEPSFTWAPGERRSITSWNAAAERLYGVPRAAAVGRDPRTLLRTRHEGGMDVVDAALARDGHWRGELLPHPEHGHEVLVETVMKQVVLPSGQQLVLETSRDVTLERRAERETQRRLRLALHANKTGIWERDFVTGETSWSPEAFEVLGADPATFVPSVEAFDRMLYPEDAPRLWAEVSKLKSGASGFECSYRIQRADGEVRWMQDSAVAVRSANGDLLRVVGTVRDITHERRLSAELAESVANYRQLANAMPQIVWTCGADGTVDWLNDRWYEFTGMQGSPNYETIAALVHPEDESDIAQRWERAIAKGTGWEAEYRLRDREGQYHWHLGRMLPVHGADGRIARLIATATNIEEHKRAEQVLRDADRRKDEFLAMLSHELRNPLAPILTAVQLSKRGVDTGQELDIIERQAKHMVRLVDDLLDVSKVAQGKIELRIRPVALAEVVTKAVELTEPLLESKRHALVVEVPQHLWVDADADRLIQIVSNLLTNAGRYTREGGRISVVARQERSEAVLQVLDNGRGISADLLPRIFDMFVQGPRSFDRHEGGLGLGLALVASLTKLHGGSVTAHSAGAGLGSEFVVRLPLRASVATQPDRESQPVIDAPLLLRRSILVVDDNEDAALLLGRALRAAGHVVCIAHDPATALEALESFRPELAILDIGLPVMNGYELGRELKRRLGSVTLYALSGYAQPNDRQQSRDAGFAHHFAKPVEVRALLTQIASEPAKGR